MMKLETNFLRGSYPPLITPFHEDGSVDHDAYERLIEYQIDAGSHGIVVNGTSAEPSVLSVAERRELLATAIRVSAGRVPIVAATGSQNFTETAELTDHATQVGADALLIVTPYYIRPPQRGLIAYYRKLAERTDLPFMIYHIPGRAAVTLDIETIEEIANTTGNFVGIKHACADLTLVTEALRRLGPDFRIFVGLEELSFPMMAIGASGMVNAVSNIAPVKVSELYGAVAKGDMAEARRLHFELFDLNQAVFFDTNPIPIKYMARRLGILDGNHHRLPMMPAPPELEKRLDTILFEAGLLPNGQ